MGNWFSSSEKKKKKASKITATDRAQLELKIQRDKLQIYIKQLESVAARETEIARELVQQKKKELALLALKKKRMQENLIKKTTDMLHNIEELCLSVEFAAKEKEVFEKLKLGKDALEEINKQMKIEDVEQFMMENEEAIQHQQRISELLAGPIEGIDEDEIERELDMYEEELRKEGVLPPAAAAGGGKKKQQQPAEQPALSSVPSHQINVKGKAEDKEEEEEEEEPQMEPAM